MQDDELGRRIDAATEAADLAALGALAEHARTPEQLERVGRALLELGDELGDDSPDAAPLLLRAAVLRHGADVPWKFACGRATYTLGGVRPWSLHDAIAFAEAGPDGLELQAPVELLLPWPEALAGELALGYAAELLHGLRSACDATVHATASAGLDDLRRAHAAGDRTRLRQLDDSLCRLHERAVAVARCSADAADAAETDPVLNERAYAWEAARIAVAAVLACTDAPHAALARLFELRRAALYPEHASQHDRERWYSRAMAEYDDLLLGDDIAPRALDLVGRLLRAAIDERLAASR